MIYIVFDFHGIMIFILLHKPVAEKTERFSDVTEDYSRNTCKDL